MKEIDWLKSLDTGEPAMPPVDVTAGVMRAVRSRAATRDEDRVLRVAAAVAAIVGAAAVAMVVPEWRASSDPFAGFGEAVDLVLR